MDVALVEDPEHDVDDHDRDHEENREISERALERLRGAAEIAADRRRQHGGGHLAVTPSDAALSRSIATSIWGLLISRSLVRSTSPGSPASAFSRSRAVAYSSSRLGDCIEY